MAGLNVPMRRSAGRRLGSAAANAPRLLMSWEDWLTFFFAGLCFVSVGVSIQNADWVNRMPDVVPTSLAGLTIGLFATRIRFTGLAVHPLALALGALVVLLAVQSYADGLTFADRVVDVRLRMLEWFNVVRSGDISNDNLPFVTLVHTLVWLFAYLAAISIYRWHNPWFAIIPGGAVLLANIAFQEGRPSTAFFFFTFGAVLLIARLHLQKAQARWQRQGIEYPDFMSLNTMEFTLALATLLVVGAWLIPIGTQAAAVDGVLDRIVRPVGNRSEDVVRLFHNVDTRVSGNFHTFGNTLPIQGNVKLGTKKLFEIQSGEGGVVRATSYDEYTGAGWRATDRDDQRLGAQEVAPGAQNEAAYQQRNTGFLRITLFSSESTLLTPGIPISANIDSIVDLPADFDGDFERMRSRRALDSGDTYNTVGSYSIASDAQLRAASTAYPAWVTERYLQLPKSLPDRVRQEAATVTAGARNPYDRAVAIQDYLRAFPYDLAVEAPPPGRDVVDWQLFDLKRGYFDLQATSMTVMLRSLGIPSRIAVGYILDPAEAQETRYTVRRDDVYSWVEVFFPDYGWVVFNPTADRPAGGAGGIQETTIPDGILGPGELADLFGPEAETVLPETAAALTETPTINERFNWLLVIIPLAVLALILATAGGLRFAWNFGLSGLEPRAQLWAKTQRLAAWAGLASHPHETAREWSRRVGATVERQDDALALARAYEESRYGRPDLRRIDEATAESSYRSLRNRLLSWRVNRRPRPAKR